VGANREIGVPGVVVGVVHCPVDVILRGAKNLSVPGSRAPSGKGGKRDKGSGIRKRKTAERFFVLYCGTQNDSLKLLSRGIFLGAAFA
jgi:hypothetical protein